MIVGATPSADRTILHTAERLYGRYKLRRVYYSAYSPIPHAANSLPAIAPPLVREHRLYQADWLIRNYGFVARELFSSEVDNLELELDPKLAWALRHRAFFPVDLNRAAKGRLLRVPGIGARGATRILALRRARQVRVDDLVALGVCREKVAPFVVGQGPHHPELRDLERKDFRERFVARARQTRFVRSLPETPQLELFGQS